MPAHISIKSFWLSVVLIVVAEIIGRSGVGPHSLVAGIVLTTVAAAFIITAAIPLFRPGEDSLSPQDTETARLRATILRLRLRSARVQKWAAIFLGLMIAALVSGLLLFSFAAQISDPVTSRALETVESQANAVKFATDYIQSKKDEENRKGISTINPTAIADLHRQSAELLASTRQLRDSISILTESAQNRRLISTITTRVGAVLILVFLAQILISLYRYSTRLAHFYDACADVIEISMGDTQLLSESRLNAFRNLLAPESIQFDKQVKAPTEQILNVARAIGSRVHGASTDA